MDNEEFDGFKSLIKDLCMLEEMASDPVMGLNIYRIRTLAEGGFYHLNYSKNPERKEIRVPYIENR